MNPYFPKAFNSHFCNSIKVNIDLSNYGTKTDLKNVTHVNTSSFALKTNLANLKTEADKLDLDKLAPVPVDLSKLNIVVKNGVVKKAVYDKLVAKVDNIDTSDFVLETKYNTDKTELENKIPDVNHLVKKTTLSELENKIPDISNLATKTALTTVALTSEFNKLATDVFNVRLAQANLITKQILILSCQVVLTEKLLKINQNIYLLKMN